MLEYSSTLSVHLHNIQLIDTTQGPGYSKRARNSEQVSLDVVGAALAASVGGEIGRRDEAGGSNNIREMPWG